LSERNLAAVINNIMLLLLLLQGSGLSDGKWVTLGAHEVDDLAVVIDHLRTQGGVSSIGLWGRSMGAVTALLYSSRDPDIAGMVRHLVHQM
jgi:pimeloyl-ACP methyl ester carboxylesterase